ncbi:MAG: penicillin-binding transpeptidase domain-containing protein [Clostridiales bacterium]|nr:penicillin-binding transpeptidase domain-containing protein [Clostridiales bacterium]
MNKVKRRAMSALLVAALVFCGIGVYIYRYINHGAEWATFAANSSVYTSGVLNTGTLTDRNGVVLAHAADGAHAYADDSAVRRACYHVVGDYAGNVGTGALGAFSAQLAGYNPITGTYASGGHEVALTIDSALNVVALNALNGRKGAVLVSNYKTGEILCMTSSPTTDPADESATIADGTYLNRCINSTFTPGSIFKLITSAAAIEQISDLESRTFTCSGSVDVAGVTVTCTGVHGSQNFEDALANSCNCAFAEISLELGADALAQYAKELGFTDAQKLDSITTAAGSFTKGAAGSANLAWSGIGQYEDLICPYSMLRLVSAIANGGSVVEPTLLLDNTNDSTTLLKTSTANKLRDMMNYNVRAHYGTNTFPGLNLCAKTGTAEVGDGTSHAWFTGFLLDDAHPYAFVVLVENGGGGLSVAGSVANTVLQAAVN